MRTYIKYLCAVLMIIGTSVHAWGTAPGANYTLVTSASSLSNGDAVILYDDVNNVGVTGTSGTSATFSSNSDDWIEYTVAKPNGSTVTLADWSLLSAPKIYADEDGNMYKFSYSTSSNTSFTINSSGHLVCSTTRLAHFGDYIRFYASSGTALKVYKVGSPKVYGEECDGNLCVNPDAIYIGGEYNGVEDALLESDKFTVTTTYSGKSHYVYVESDDDELLFDVYDYEYDESFGSEGYYTAGSGEDISQLKIVCYASAAGTYSATLHVYAYNYDGAGNYKHVAVPVTITVLEEEQECTARTLSFANGTSDKTIYKADGTTYTNAATPSTGAGYGTVTYSVTSASPSGCATVNGSGVVSFSNYGSATITASLGANGDYCAAADVSYTVSMECKSRTLSFASSTPSVSVTTDTYTQTATKSAGSGTISYAMVQSVGSGFTIDSETGEVSFNGNAGTATITASITADATGGYCTAEGSYTLTVTPVVPTVSAFSYSSGETSMTLNGSAVTDNGGTAISAYGYIYSTTASAVGTLVLGGEGVTTAQVAAANIAVGTAFAEKSITSLSEGATYYVRAYATNSAGTGYSDIQTVKTVTYSDYMFSCADLQLDEPTNGADNVVSNVVYLTSTNGQKVRSLAHFRVHGDGLTASQTVKFTTGDDDLDELYTFRKADGTEVATNSSGVVDEEVYIFYQPTTTTDGRDVATSVKAYVERKGDGSGKPKAVVNDERTINGRHLPSQFIIAAKSGGVWYALPSDASVTGAQMGYTFTADNTTTPTKATVAPQTALYSIYAPRADGTNKSYVRFASTNDGKTLWSNNSTSKIGIKDNAAVDGPSSKGDQYEWRLENTSADSYKLWNNASYDGAGRYLGLSGTKWNVYETNVSIVQDLKILPVDAISDYIGLEATEWEETAFSFTITSGSEPDPYDHVVVGYNGKNYDASISGTKLTITDADFVTDGGFGAASGSQLIVAWCDDEDVVLAQGSVLSPIIVNSNTVNLSEYDSEELSIMDVFITNGAKLTINESTTVHNVTVNPGATLFVNETDGGDAVTMQLYNGKLMLRGGWTTISGDAAYDMPRVYINPLSTLTKTNTNVNFDISVDKRNYYPFAVPFRVRVKDVNYANPTLRAAATYGTHYVIKEYSGKLRADNGPDRENNWVVVPKTDPESGEDVYLEPGKGYILTAVSIPAYGGGIIRFPMSFANAWTTLGEQGSVSATTKNVIEVTAHEGAATTGGGANNRHKGWNMLGVPFMSCYTSGTDMYDGEGSADLMTGRMTLTGDPADPYGWETGDVVYVSVPSHDFAEYVQTDITEAKLRPAWSFFIQVGTTGDLTFLTTKQREDSDMPIYAPKRETSPVMKTGIILSGGEASDKTTILISNRYSSDYEIGADLEKMFGNGYTLATYSLSCSTRLAYNAMSKSDATAVIPIGYRAPAEGEYTYSLNPRYAEANFERVDLIDYQTGSLTNLMTSSYTFTTGRTQDDSRFALNVVMKPTITTDVENGANGENDANGVEKVIINDHMYIIRSGQMYDATGKCVKGGQK